MPRVPDGRVGVYNRVGLFSRVGGTSKYMYVNNARSGGWVVHSLLGLLGGNRGQKIFIFGKE